MRFPSLRIYQITDQRQLTPYRVGLTALLGQYRGILLPDATELSDADARHRLVENTASCMPFLWLITDTDTQVFGAAALMDLTPGGRAFLHGATHLAIRRHPIITELAWMIFRLAFQEYSLQAINAEFSAHNWGAWGFCRRMGFQRELTQSPHNGHRTYILSHQRFQEIMHHPYQFRKETCHANWQQKEQ